MSSTIVKARITVAVIAALAGVVVLTVSPAAAQHSPGFKCVEQVPYYLQGGSFSQDPQRNAVPSTQHAGQARQKLVASWEGDFDGTVCGEAEVTVYVATVSGEDAAAPLATPWLARFMAGSTEVGVQEVTFPTSATPEESVFTLPVAGTVTDTLSLDLRRSNSNSNAAIFFDSHDDYPAQFILSVLEPCLPDDTHPDCTG